MKVATWNVNSITARLPLVLKWIETARPDALCLQEIKCVEERFPREAFSDLG
ncbi:MAG TPA: endonuclease/exonuclease/phosphatase family protein, partial [Blastocatellia bacterium]|nr:endonuclease/exonuclease/phosphatase family protein [Blastocatellia bacterium]